MNKNYLENRDCEINRLTLKIVNKQISMNFCVLVADVRCFPQRVENSSIGEIDGSKSREESKE